MSIELREAEAEIERLEKDVQRLESKLEKEAEENGRLRSDARKASRNSGNSQRDTGRNNSAARTDVNEAAVGGGESYVVTAYTAGPESTGKSPGESGYGITASGATVSEGTTVACPRSLDFGTVVRIDGIGERVCHDRGSDITEGRLDVYMSDLGKAQEYGRQSVSVQIISEGER